ncbi:MAG TPA: hypothetical protein VJT09_11655 [Pyrinomonadaceae bacterium]|nr:hypothetical protein [Pyrinomonadaceae bacterium]
MIRKFLVGLALLVLAAPAALGQEAEREANLRSLVEAERAFASASVARGIKTSFIENMNDASILFRPGPVAGKRWMEERPAS